MWKWREREESWLILLVLTEQLGAQWSVGRNSRIVFAPLNLR